MRSLEQKLFEAHQRGTGCHLTVEDVHSLIDADDAMLSRISNAAAAEAGVDEPGDNCLKPAYSGESWSQFKRRLTN